MYYNRPSQIITALNSIRIQKHTNWHVVFIDDGSEQSGEQIVRDFFNDEELRKVSFYNTHDSPEIKRQRAEKYKHLEGSDDKNSGAWIIPYFNKAIKENKHDIALFLCDDDVLHESYLENLNNYYNNNTEVMYSYCVVILFDVRYHNHLERTDINSRFLHIEPINPFFNLDTTQVSWRSDAYYKYDIWFDEEYHLFFDADWYNRLFEKYGLCVCNMIVGQYKNYDINSFHLNPEMIEKYNNNTQ